MKSSAEMNGFERLWKEGMYSKSGTRRVDGSVEMPSQRTSDACSRCGGRGLTVYRQLNAAISLYLKMEGVPHRMNWWDECILPTLMCGYFLTGEELKAPDELVRELYDAAKSELYCAYDRYADAYLSVPM
jgi:hypothetical protein